MIQRHSIILWKKAVREDKTFEEISKEAYEILNLFQDLGYSISFFSSMDEKASCAFQMQVGNKNDKFC